MPAAQVNPAARTDLDRKSLRIASVQTRRLNFSAWSISKSYLPVERFGPVAVGKLTGFVVLARRSKLPFQASVAVILEHFCQLDGIGKATLSRTEVIADLSDYSGAPASVSIAVLVAGEAPALVHCSHVGLQARQLVRLITNRCLRHFFHLTVFRFCTFLLFSFFAFRPSLLDLLFGARCRRRRWYAIRKTLLCRNRACHGRPIGTYRWPRELAPP